MGRPGLTQNRKFRRLALEVGGNASARGHLELLWDSAYEAGDELVGDAVDVELAADWKGTPGVLASAMTRAGFLDELDGSFTIHDFWHHAPAYVRKRRTRENERRSKVDPCYPKGKPVTSQRPVSDIPTGSQQDENGPTPSPSPSPLNKRIPPTAVGLSEGDSIWHSRLRESWAKNQPDGKAAPYSPPGATEKLFQKILRSKVANGEELAWAGHIYCQRMLESGQYVVALKTFLGPQGFWQAELNEARAMIASQQVGA